MFNGWETALATIRGNLTAIVLGPISPKRSNTGDAIAMDIIATVFSEYPVRS